MSSADTTKSLGDDAAVIRNLKKRLAIFERLEAEPIAIVGIGCRYPGGIVDAETFWRLLEEGIDAVTEVPRERWDIDALYDPDPAAPGKMTTRCGGLLAGIGALAAGCLGIPARRRGGRGTPRWAVVAENWGGGEREGAAAARAAGGTRGGDR